MKLIFCLQVKVKVVFRLILLSQLCVARHTQITKSNKFPILSQYLKKEVSDKTEFLHPDKHESLLQVDTMILMGMVKHSQRSQSSQCQLTMSFNISKKKLDEVYFLYANKHQSFQQVDLNTLGIKVFHEVILSLSIGLIKHPQSTQTKNFAISYNISKQSLGMEFLKFFAWS